MSKRVLRVWDWLRHVLSLRSLLDWIGCWKPLIAAILGFIAAFRGDVLHMPFVYRFLVVFGGSFVVLSLASMIRTVLKALTEHPQTIVDALPTPEAPSAPSSRIQIGERCESAALPAGKGSALHLIPVKNVEARYAYTCHNLKAELSFTFVHTGEICRKAGYFARPEGQQIASRPVPAM